MARIRTIARAFPITAGVHPEVVHGIVEYAQKRDCWTFLCGSQTLAMSALSLREWLGDGVIAKVVTNVARKPDTSALGPLQRESQSVEIRGERFDPPATMVRSE